MQEGAVIPDWTTLLFVPADRPERYAKAAACGADAIVIDLEDAVSPAAKIAAREVLSAASLNALNIPLVARINGVDTPWFDDDMAVVTALPFDAIMLPKADSAAVISEVVRRVADRHVIALIETPLGLAAARDIARAGSSRLAFGSIDFCAAVGCMHERDALLAARNELVLASSLGAITSPLDGVTTKIGDAAGCEDDARYARTLGFSGKLCIHPAQIEPTVKGFMPGEEEIAWAKKVLEKCGEGAAAVAGFMVDAPVRLGAERVLARASRRYSSDQ